MNDKLIVTQAYELINSRYKVSELEAKIIMLTISQIAPDDEEFKTYKMSINDISKKLQAKQNHTLLRKTAEDLLSKPLFIENKKGWKGFNWFSYIEYHRDEAMLEVAVDTRLKPYLLELKKNFKSYNIEYIIKMNSSYAIRIYQLLKQYQKIGNRTLNVAEMQEMFQVPKSMKNLYSNFKIKVLNVSTEQINKYTDLSITFKEIKTGRKVTDINFIIKTKPSDELQTMGLFEAEPTEIPEEIEMIKGLYSFKNDDNFYTPFTDGSFNLEKEDGSKQFFKSLKQFIFFTKNPDKF